MSEIEFKLDEVTGFWIANIPLNYWNNGLFDWCCKTFEPYEWESGSIFAGDLAFQKEEYVTLFKLRWS